jgi:hypothetical protein
MSDGGGADILVYQWLAWKGYLVTSLFPEAVAIPCRLTDDADAVVGRSPRGFRAFLFHLNCTIPRNMPRGRTHLVSWLGYHRKQVLNGGVENTSKRWLQQTLAAAGLPTVALTPGFPRERAVIVKSDLNFGGRMERHISRLNRTLLGIPEPSESITRTEQYYIARLCDLDQSVLSDPSLVVERYVSNSGGRWFRGYRCGPRVAICELISDHPIKKGTNSRITNVYLGALEGGFAGGAPDGLVRVVQSALRHLGIEFGAIDIAHDDDSNYYVIDINPTPYWDDPDPELVRHLRDGLWKRLT